MSNRNNLNQKTSASLAAKYESQYGDHIEMCSQLMHEKYEYDWSTHDSIAFGLYADNWSEFREVFESDATTRDAIGPALSSNMGIIAMSYASLPIQNLASIQPLSDETGTAYFRKNLAVTTRGGVTAGEELMGAYGSVNGDIANFTSEDQVASQITNIGGGDGPYVFAMGAGVKAGQVRINVAGGKIKGLDDGEGHIVGLGIDAELSTIDYTTGAATITLIDSAGKGVVATDTIDVGYSNNLVAAEEIPSSKWVLEPKVVRVNYYLLQSQYSNLSEMVLRKRFGADMNNEITGDLVAQINGAVMHKAITELRKGAILSETQLGTGLSWSLTAPPGVSDIDHRRTFDDRLIDAVDRMYQITGKGDVSAMVVGSKGKQVLKSAGMRMIKSSVSGPHLCGMYDDTPVYYAPNTAIGANEMLVVYRGANWYEAPIVYTPFLPVTTVSATSVGNVLNNASAVYHAAGVDLVQHGFVQRITFTV